MYVTAGTPGESPDPADGSSATRRHYRWRRLTFTADWHTLLCTYQDGAVTAGLSRHWRRHRLRQSSGHGNREMWMCVIAGLYRASDCQVLSMLH